MSPNRLLKEDSAMYLETGANVEYTQNEDLTQKNDKKISSNFNDNKLLSPFAPSKLPKSLIAMSN